MNKIRAQVLIPTLKLFGKAILTAQDIRELSWNPSTKRYGLSHLEAATDAVNMLVEVSTDSSTMVHENEAKRELVELVFMLNLLAWNDAQLLSDRLVSLSNICE